MCRVLEVSPAGHYAWRACKPSQRAAENEGLVEQIKASRAESRGIYGWLAEDSSEVAASGRDGQPQTSRATDEKTRPQGEAGQEVQADD